VDYMTQCRSRNSSASIATGYELDRSGSIPGKGIFFLFSTASIPVLGATQPPIQWVPGALSPGVKRPEREADHWSPSSTKIKKGGAIPPFPNISSWHSA
jgi:hypothetical protein